MTDREFRLWVGLSGLIVLLAIWRGIAAAPVLFGVNP
jgi:hypothetical protein